MFTVEFHNCIYSVELYSKFYNIFYIFVVSKIIKIIFLFSTVTFAVISNYKYFYGCNHYFNKLICKINIRLPQLFERFIYDTRFYCYACRNCYYILIVTFAITLNYKLIRNYFYSYNLCFNLSSSLWSRSVHDRDNFFWHKLSQSPAGCSGRESEVLFRFCRIKLNQIKATVTSLKSIYHNLPDSAKA